MSTLAWQDAADILNLRMQQILDEINRNGPITFARFMELALYAPDAGYYERPREIGRGGDFFTSVSVGPVFGELLAFKFAQWAGDEPCQIIEAGAHQGALAADILAWLQRHRPRVFEKFEYVIVEPSAARRRWQEQTLQPWLPQIKWLTEMGEAKPTESFRIIFSNELLDAMPAHRLAWNAAENKWEECLVALENGRLVWRRGPNAMTSMPGLPDGFLIEVSPAATAWWKSAAEILAPGHGKLMTIDYGLTREERFQPRYADGTLRACSRHHTGGDLFDNIGTCDITAHVDFSAIETAGLAAGLVKESFAGQEKFLMEILAQTEAAPGSFEAWTPSRTRQFQTLTHPNQLGRAFRALILAR